jgi:transcriptional regulator with XRE-family HTH domain
MSTQQERKEIGRRFAAARKRRGLTQAEVSERSGVSLGAINNLENGRSLPQVANRTAIVSVIGEDIFGGELADAARSAWPKDVQVFIDVLGQYLSVLPPEERATHVSRWMGEILNGD